jgi:hypothetical protein
VEHEVLDHVAESQRAFVWPKRKAVLGPLHQVPRAVAVEAGLTDDNLFVALDRADVRIGVLEFAICAQ